MWRIPRLALRPRRTHARAGRARLATSARLLSPRKLAHLKKLQADYQCEDGRPIYLKSGFRDRVLYSATLLLVIVGLANVFLTIYDHAKPPSWKGKTC